MQPRVLAEPTVTRLLQAIEASSLVLLCGAGLSRAAPSNLPSAVHVANICYDKYAPIQELPAALRGDIDKLAAFFFDGKQFEPVFIRTLVPWAELVGPPNIGHAAIADLLICRAALTAVSANFDPLIEFWATARKVDLRGALTGEEAIEFASKTSPLLKFHGCLLRERDHTIWTHQQLLSTPIKDRVQSCSDWMRLHLAGKDILVLGFWSDWGYLNDVLAAALNGKPASSVTVIDPSPTKDLETKAPKLWKALNELSHGFEHVKASADEALREVRAAYSRAWLRKLYALGAPLMQALGKGMPPQLLPDILECEELYDLRRDAEGVSYDRAAAQKEPPRHLAQCALAHLLLLASGAVRDGAWFKKAELVIRAVNGAGRPINDVRDEHNEPAVLSQPDIVLCAGAIDLGLPARVVPEGSGASILRPKRGGTAKWLTLEAARQELVLD